MKLAALKNDCSLFSQLYIASKFRDGDLDRFFSHENTIYPPALSKEGKLNLPSQKSDLLGLIAPETYLPVPSVVDVKIIDGATIVHSLPVDKASTFGEYASEVILPWIKHQLKTCNRVNMVWDVYKDNSLKESTRQKRGQGIRQKVGAMTKLPRKFCDFLKDSKNKEELFQMLAESIKSTPFEEGKQVYATKGRHVVSSGQSTSVPECDHEEADTRVCLHIADALQNGVQRIVVRTVDTDIVVILLGVFGQLLDNYPYIDMWVAFGMGQNFREIHINSVFKTLGKDSCMALPGFHAFTGCDTTSQFQGKGKKDSMGCMEIISRGNKIGRAHV